MPVTNKAPISSTAHRLAELHSTLTAMVRLLVDTPEDVEILIKTTLTSTVFEVKMAAGEIGMVIGGNGRNAKSLRTWLMAATGNDEMRYRLNIEDPGHVSGFRGGKPTFSTPPENR